MALISLIPVAVVGGGLGLLSGFAGGKVDAIVTGALDNIPAFPLLLFAMLVTAAFDPGLTGLPIAATLVLWPGVARAAGDEVAVLKAGGGFSLSNAMSPIICAADPSLRAVHPHGSDAERSGPGNRASNTIVGQHDGWASATDSSCAVDRYIPRLGTYSVDGDDDSVTLEMVEDIGQWLYPPYC